MFNPADPHSTLLFAAILGILHVIFTLRVGLYRGMNNIGLGDGGDPALLKLIRGHANFTENVPIGLILLLLNELNNLSQQYLLILGCLFVLGRLLHYLSIVTRIPIFMRLLSMIMTLGVILASSILLII
ncbi:MAG: MAPEG family protein [Halioglobus sp.]|nr:MAPEG family protein [Halioglobus sp.]